MDRLISNPYDLLSPHIVDANRRGQITQEQVERLGGVGTLFIALLNGWGVVKILFLIPFACLIGFFVLAWVNAPGGVVLLLVLAAALVFIYLLISRVVKFVSWRRALKRELDGGNIRQGTGELVFGKNAFEFQLADQRLRLPFWGRGDIEPGVRYTVYYLPESRTALSAEPLHPISERRVSQSLTEILAEVNGFDLDALSENRQGRLRVSQMKHFLSRMVSSSLLTFLPGGFIYYQSAIQDIPLSVEDLDLGSILLFGIPGAIALYGLYRLVSVLVDIVGGWAESVEGPGSIKTKVVSSGEAGSRTEYYYQVGDMQFKVNRRAFKAFEENRQYRVFYTPATKTMVNIEAI